MVRGRRLKPVSRARQRATGGGSMKTVNLLPAWYLKQRRRQRNLRVHAVAMVLIGAGMVSAIFVGRQHLAVMNQQRDQLAARLTQVSDPDVELRAKKAERSST